MSIEIHPTQETSKGSTINSLSVAIERVFNNIQDFDSRWALEGFQIDTALGNDLDNIAALFGIERNTTGESDLDFRARLKLEIASRIPVTKDAIQDMFELITSLRPVIIEDFSTKLYQAGQAPSPNEELAAFEVHFNIDITQVFEQLLIRNDGESVQVGHFTNIDSGGTIAAYHATDDPFHATDISDTLDADTGIMTLIDGPYLLSSLIDVEYEIIPDTDYDTVEELYANKDNFTRLVSLSKAAGVKTSDVKISKFLGSLFKDGGVETYTVSDVIDFMIINFMGTVADFKGIIKGFDFAKFGINRFEIPEIVFDEIYRLKNVTGAVADDGGSQTTETTGATNDTEDDMTLLPTTPAVDDAYYFAGDEIYERIRLLISTPADWVGTIVYEYSQGASSWGTLTLRVDEWDDFKGDGYVNIRFDAPSDWATDTVNGIATKYWIRAKVSAYTSVVTAPKGARVFTEAVS